MRVHLLGHGFCTVMVAGAAAAGRQAALGSLTQGEKGRGQGEAEERNQKDGEDPTQCVDWNPRPEEVQEA